MASIRVPAQAPTFSTRIVTVRVDALVADDRGRPLTGLRAGDFEVLDNGVPQQIDLVSFGKLPLNVVLALDLSASMAGDRLVRLRDAARAVIGGLRPADRAALVTFSHLVSRSAPLTDDLASVRTALDHVEAGGETALFDAAYAALLTGQADAGRTLVIIFSDGIDTSSWLTAESVLLAARRSNAVVYAATSGTAARLKFLRDLTRLSGGSTEVVDSDRDMTGVFVKILEQFRGRYLLGFTPTGVPQAGWHTLEVNVKDRRAVVTTREGYIAGP